MKKVLFVLSLVLFSIPLNAQTTTFNFTGGMQTYIVPAGINELTIDMYGAKGGDGGLGTKIGGFGGRVQTTLTVTPGQTLSIFVGGMGVEGDCVSATPFPGGYNGGGDGYFCGASGGGASDIRIGGINLNDRVIVAGGGGGGGDDFPSGDKGGDGGGLIGANGEYGFDPNVPETGKGGSQSSGGAAGTNSISFVDDGLPGVLGIGGRSSTTYAGGGGGGGYYGGGGGAAAGGGGGSSYSDPTLTTGTIHTQGENGSNGQVIITEVCNSSPPTPSLSILPDVTGSCSASAPTAPTATNCLGTFTGTTSTVFPITSQGTTIITWTYNDGNGSTSTQTQQVIINDNTAPVADVATLFDLTDQCEITTLTAPTATDNCVGAVTGTHNVSLPITAQGTTTITWTFDDGNGNTSTQTQDVVITDVTAPAADLANLSDINSECEVTPTAPTATDNCAGAISGTPDVSFPITATGTTTVIWTYDDGNSNTSTQTQDVVITPIDNTVSVVNDITLSADASGYTYQWVDCNDNNAPIAGETNQTFVATANGSYAVIIDSGNCSVTSACNDITTVGLDQNQIETISVYPNPTSGILTIRSSGVFDKIEIMNTLGQVVSSIELNQLDEYQIQLPDAKGVYVVKVSDQANYKIVRIIKK